MSVRDGELVEAPRESFDDACPRRFLKLHYPAA